MNGVQYTEEAISTSVATGGDDNEFDMASPEIQKILAEFLRFTSKPRCRPDFSILIEPDGNYPWISEKNHKISSGLKKSYS